MEGFVAKFQHRRPFLIPGNRTGAGSTLGWDSGSLCDLWRVAAPLWVCVRVWGGRLPAPPWSAPPRPRALLPLLAEATHLVPGPWGSGRTPPGELPPGRPLDPQARQRRCGAPGGSSPRQGLLQPGHGAGAQRRRLLPTSCPAASPSFPPVGAPSILTVPGSAVPVTFPLSPPPGTCGVNRPQGGSAQQGARVLPAPKKGMLGE